MQLLEADERLILRMLVGRDLGVNLPSMRNVLSMMCERNGGRWTVDGLNQKFLTGDWQMWCVYRPRDDYIFAVIGTALHIEMNGSKSCDIKFCTGVDMKQWVHLLDHIEIWAMSEGCARIKTIARPGWKRKLKDYKCTHVQLEKVLNG
jgi:hypothetical protein